MLVSMNMPRRVFQSTLPPSLFILNSLELSISVESTSGLRLLLTYCHPQDAPTSCIIYSLLTHGSLQDRVIFQNNVFQLLSGSVPSVCGWEFKS